jgi:mono/diheme cytochrome c family protein
MTNQPNDPIHASTLLVVLLVTVSGCATPGRFMRGYAEAEPTEMELLETGGAFADAPPHLQGQVRFAFDAFGSLSTDALKGSAFPWKLLVAAIALDRHETTGAPISLNTAYAVFEEFGFLRPRRIANWHGPQPRLQRPLGIVSGLAHRGFPAVELEIGAFGCAMCHGGPLYGADGRPTGDAWLGLPNTSIDLSAFGSAASLALERQLPHEAALLEATVTIFPQVSDDELSVLRKHVIPAAFERFTKSGADGDGTPRFDHGGPGLMNGAAVARKSLGRLEHDAWTTEIAWTSPPDLSETTLRKSLLVDAMYAPSGGDRFGPRTRADVAAEGLRDFADMTTLFVFTTFGQPKTARDKVNSVRDLVSFFDRMTPPPFPGVVDTLLVAEGEQVYQAACAVCHGNYSSGTEDVRLLEHPNRLVAQDRMGTDPARWVTADSISLAAIADLGWEDQVSSRNFGGYVAPDLSGVWATAPYLHNGSVPTLWHLLHAEQRPDRFMVGGHALDYELMGIAGEVDEGGDYVYPSGYEPWSHFMLYDTHQPGRSNAGHEFPGLSTDQKTALLEYLKLL